MRLKPIKFETVFLFWMTLFFFSQSLFASFEVGGALNSLTSGRVIPSVEFSFSAGDSLYSWVGAGVKNNYYYQTSHQFSYFKTWNAGSFWGGDIQSSFGVSGAYLLRSFTDEGSTTEEKSTDYILGPAIRMSWSYGFLFLNMTATFGIRDLWQHLSGLTFQDIETLSIGMRF